MWTRAIRASLAAGDRQARGTVRACGTVRTARCAGDVYAAGADAAVRAWVVREERRDEGRSGQRGARGDVYAADAGARSCK